MCRYSCFRERKHDDEFGDYSAYGIALDGAAVVHGLSTNYIRVQDLVERCNKGALDPIHLPDVIEDFLALDIFREL